MTREYVINQLVYYLNYGFISKELQEDIKEVLMQKKDIFVLERLLDSVEYELNKNSKNNFNKFNNTTNPVKNINRNDRIYTENNKNKHFKLTPVSLNLSNKKKNKNL